jgi:tetratricopeptide (TPR) repeat protein
LQKAAEEKSIAGTDQLYRGEQSKASTDASARGWKQIAQGDLTDAMRSFNQARLLDNSNGSALWGMAVIEARSGTVDESLRLFAEADKSVGSDIAFSVDYARALGTAGFELHDEALLKAAFDRFEQNYRRAPENTMNLQNWAIALFCKENYSEAWAKIKLAEATPGKSALDPRFLAALQMHMPRPKD